MRRVFFGWALLPALAMTLVWVSVGADARPNRLPCRDTVSYATGQQLLKVDGWVGDPTDGREALYGPRGTCVLVAV